MDLQSAFVLRLKKLMEEKNLTVYELAKRANLSIYIVDAILNGKTKLLKTSTVQKIIKGLEIDFKDLKLSTRNFTGKSMRKHTGNGGRSKRICQFTAIRRKI